MALSFAQLLQASTLALMRHNVVTKITSSGGSFQKINIFTTKYYILNLQQSYITD